MTTRTLGLIGERLKQMREKNGLTQTELATAMGVAQQAINRWERGKLDASLPALKDMARILGVSADYLLGLVDNPKDHYAEDRLTPEQRKLLWLIDQGMSIEAIEEIAGLAKRRNQS